MLRHLHLFIALLIIICSCDKKYSQSAEVPMTAEKKGFPTTGSIEVLDSALADRIRSEAKIEIIADGFLWAEGPLWLEKEQALLFSDVPANRIYQWSETAGLQLYLTPSGYTGQEERGGETGSNGLLLDSEGRLVICQHGDRRMARMDASTASPKPRFIALADKYQGKHFNSPNDAVYRDNGELYFTDPPYGLEKKMEDPEKEIPFQGVYRLSKDGTVHLLTKTLSRPNGIAFSPDGKTLYVANSDSENAVWMAFDVQDDGSIANGRIFFDATDLARENKGLPDGLKVARDGTLFASGPGGILVISDSGRHLGTIRTGEIASNCAFNKDESILYITADDYLMRVKIKR